MRLLGDAIFVKVDEIDDTVTKSGIVMPVGVETIVYRYGTVTHVGPGWWSQYTGERIPVDVEVGDRVIYHHAHGQPVELEDEEYLMLQPNQIVAIADPE